MISSPVMDAQCVLCLQPKAVLCCGICAKPVCKKCAESLPRDFFSFLKTTPVELSHPNYCGVCFDQHVAKAKDAYEKLLRKAKTVTIFYKKERHVPVQRQSNAQLQIKDCVDRDEALLRLAFFAAELGRDAVIHVEVIPEKIKINGYQSTRWHAKGFPAMLQKFG